MRLKCETCERALQTSHVKYFCHTIVGMGGGPIFCVILKRNGGQNHQRAAAPLYGSEKPFDGHISDGKGKAFPKCQYL